MNYKELTEKRDFLYVLRRTIPPWKWEEALQEAVLMCRKYAIDELCVFIDSGTFTHAYPTLEWLRNYQKILFRIKEALEEAGIVYSLNPNVTQGHGDRGRHVDRQHPDWSMITSSAGVRATDCACSISRGWRDYLRKQWTLYAETHPAVIWIEDDIRWSGHGPVGTGCFCDEHIRRFNERCGSVFTREEIAAKVFAHGTPDPLRKLWLDFLRECTEEVIRLMEETVHAVSPETIVGLMSSGPDYHTVDGRDWGNLYRIMSGPGKRPVASRPPLGNYEEGSLTGLRQTVNQIRLTRRAFASSPVSPASPCIEEGEIENFPYSNYSKSNTFLFLQNSAAIGSGCDALTLNLFDHSGTPMAANEDILKSLLAQKPFLSALKERYPRGGSDAGLGGCFFPGSAEKKHLGSNSACAGGLQGESCDFAEHLQNMGFAVGFQEDPPVSLLCGQNIRAASDAEIRKILSRAAFIDAAAFQALCERGFGEYLGAEIRGSFRLNTTFPIGGEHLLNRTFGGGEKCFFDTAIHTRKPLVLELGLLPGAEEISCLVDVDLNRRFPCCCYYENKAGGRIAVYPVETGALSSGFATPKRKEMLHHLFRRLSGGRELPLFLGGDRRALPFRVDGETHSLIGLYNLSLDPLDGIEARMNFSAEPGRVEVLSPAGEWTPFHEFRFEEEGTLIFRLERFRCFQPLYFCVYPKFKREDGI